MVTLLDAVQMAYRKHHLDDPSIGWDELSDCLMMALCNEMGDLAFQVWLEDMSRPTLHAPDRLPQYQKYDTGHPDPMFIVKESRTNGGG